MKTIYFCAAFVVFLGLTATLALATVADVIVQPLSATTNMNSSGLRYMIDQSGLSAQYVSGVTDFASYTATTTHLSSGNTAWIAILDTGEVTLDLGSVLAIDGAALWNYGCYTCATVYGIRTFDLSTSVDGINFTRISAFILDQGVQRPVPAEDFMFVPVDARYVRMGVLGSWGGWRGSR